MENKQIRILQCVSNMDRAGIETMLMNYYRNIDRTKIQFDFLCNKNKPGHYDEEILKLGGKIYLSPGLNPLKWFKYQSYMSKLFKNHPEYKIIHCQNEAMGFYALSAAKKNNIPIRIAHSHNTMIRFDFKYLIKMFCRKNINKVSNVQVACGKDAGIFLFGKDVLIIKNSIDTSKFIFNKKIREKIRNKYNLNDSFVIGCVGRFEPQKNHNFLIKVFDKYSKINDKAVLLLIGDGSLKEQIKRKIKKLGLDKKVIFTGNVPNVNEFYNAMDIFVLPSRHEGLPVVGVEAQANDLTCLFSKKVTKEVKITDKIYYLDLNIDKWVNCLSNIGESIRNNNKKIIESKGYDILTEARKVQEWYIDMYNGVYHE